MYFEIKERDGINTGDSLNGSFIENQPERNLASTCKGNKNFSITSPNIPLSKISIGFFE
jgi:hypothetical protein